jgi:hypothetical protein
LEEEEEPEGENEGEEEKSSEDSEDEIDELNMMGDEDQYESEGEDDYEVYDDEEDEFDNIASNEALPKGEKWLMQEFLATNEEAQIQNLLIAKCIDNNAVAKKQMKASMHSQNDISNGDNDKPQMRPITPKKFTNSNNNTSVFEPDSSSRNLPREMVSRGKNQRTPSNYDQKSDFNASQHDASIGSPTKSVLTDMMGENVTDNGQDDKSEVENEKRPENGIYKDHNEEMKIIPNEDVGGQDDPKKKEQMEKLNDPVKKEEFSQAFKSEAKIRRTPPKEAKMRYIREKKKKLQSNIPIHPK